MKALSLVTSSLGVAFLLNDRCLSHSSETETRHALIQSALRRAVSLEPAEAERLLLMLFKRLLFILLIINYIIYLLLIDQMYCRRNTGHSRFDKLKMTAY